MSWLILLGIVVLLLVLRQSLVLVFAVAAAYIHVFIANSKLEFLLQDFWFTVDREVLLSIPLFILAANLFNASGITHHIFGFANALVGHIRGGMGHVNILASLFFSGM